MVSGYVLGSGIEEWYLVMYWVVVLGSGVVSGSGIGEWHGIG